MNKINQSKWFFLAFLVLYVSVNEAKRSSTEENVNVFDLEWIKNDLFSKTDFDLQPEFAASASNQWQCKVELCAIQKGLKKFEPWTKKRK